MIDLPTFKLEAYFARWEFAVKYHLTASDAETWTINEILEMGSASDRRAFQELDLGYRPTKGSDEIRSAIAETYESCSSEDVICFAGVEEALFWVLAVLAKPDDHVIVVVPNYQSMEDVPRSCRASVTGVPLGSGPDWSIDVETVRTLIRENTRILALNFPNNPTGFIPDAQTLIELARLCDQHGIRLVCDEVFRGLEIDRSRMLPQVADLSTEAISVNGTSKSFGLPGLRVGWVASHDHELLTRLERKKHFTSICNSAASEALATIALNNADSILARNRHLIEKNLDIFDAFFGEWSELFDWYHPDGGCVAFPAYRGSEGTERMCHELLESEGVLILPPSIFSSTLDATPMDRFRIGVGRRNPEPALDAFDRFLRSR